MPSVGKRSKLWKQNLEVNERARWLMEVEQWLGAIAVIRSQKSHEGDHDLASTLSTQLADAANSMAKYLESIIDDIAQHFGPEPRERVSHEAPMNRD